MEVAPKTKIFITGATGFLGRFLVKKLVNDGYNNIICCLHSANNETKLENYNDKVLWKEGDILDITFLDEVLKDIDIVIHAAAIVSFDNKFKSLMFKVANDGTENLINYALKHRIKKFIHISSVAALGRSKLVENIDENKIFSHSIFDTNYGLSKFMAEQQVWRGYAEGLDVVILNPSNILGKSQFDSSANKIINLLKDGLTHYPRGVTGWVDVNDVAQAVVSVLNKDISNERIIISSQNLSYNYVLSSICVAMGFEPPKKILSSNFAKIVIVIERIKSLLTGKSPIITKDSILSSSVTNYYDNNKSINLLGIEYKDISQTIKEMASN